MSDAFNEQGALRCGAPDVGVGIPVEEMVTEDMTREYFELCYNALFDISGYASRVLEGTELDLFSPIEDLIELRRQFQFAPEALRCIASAFEESLQEEAERERERLNAIIGPLPSASSWTA